MIHNVDEKKIVTLSLPKGILELLGKMWAHKKPRTRGSWKPQRSKIRASCLGLGDEELKEFNEIKELNEY